MLRYCSYIIVVIAEVLVVAANLCIFQIIISCLIDGPTLCHNEENALLYVCKWTLTVITKKVWRKMYQVVIESAAGPEAKNQQQNIH